MVIQDKHNPTVINYVALLGPRDEAPFINVPQTSVVAPMLRLLGKLPQNMAQFIYGIEYYERMKFMGLQLGYGVSFIYPDFDANLFHILGITEGCPTVLLLCTDDVDAIKCYNKLFDGLLSEDSLCIIYKEVLDHWTVECSKASNYEEVWDWFYSFAEKHYTIDYTRNPFCVPILSKSVHDEGYVFSPSRINTEMLNSALGNWQYARDLPIEEQKKERADSEIDALRNPDSFDRQDILVAQIGKMRNLESMVMGNATNRFTTEDQFRSSLVIAAPYTSIEARKIPNKEQMEGDALRDAEYMEKILGYHYAHSYTVWVNYKGMTAEKYALFKLIQSSFIMPRMEFFDFVGMLHSSIKFSPYLRLPVLGKNINAELSFVGIDNLSNFIKFKSKRKDIHKAMVRIGRKIANEALSPNAMKMLESDASQIVALSDLPIEWIMINGAPLGFTHDVCRVPETPCSGMLAQYVESIYTPYVIPKDILKKTLVIYGNEDEKFVEAQKPVNKLSERLGFSIRKCLNKQEFIKTVKEINPDFLIIDSHGGVDPSTRQSFFLYG